MFLSPRTGKQAAKRARPKTTKHRPSGAKPTARHSAGEARAKHRHAVPKPVAKRPALPPQPQAHAPLRTPQTRAQEKSAPMPATTTPKAPKKSKPVAPASEAPMNTPAVRAPVPSKPAPAPKKPKPPAKTMKVAAPLTDFLLKEELPELRRIHARKQEGARGVFHREPQSKPNSAHDADAPLDASLMVSSLSSESRPQIEDNYDYSVLDEFRGSGFCPAPTRMVNTGCGGGEAAVYFARLGYKSVGIDSDRMAVGLARERAWLANSEIDFMVGDLFETPNLLPAESFGLALDRGAFSRLQEDRDRQRYLANIRRLLFKGGVLFLSAGFFPLPDDAEKRKARKPAQKLLLAQEGGMVVYELRAAGFDLLHRVLRKTNDSGEYGELLLYLRK